MNTSNVARKKAMPPMPEPVAAVFGSFPVDVADALRTVRTLIFQLGDELEAGPLTETLKWGEPAYLTEASKSGSTIRLGWKAKFPHHGHIFFNCNTDLVARCRGMFPDQFTFEGNRGLSFDVGNPLPVTPIKVCLTMALLYHRDKKRRQ